MKRNLTFFTATILLLMSFISANVMAKAGLPDFTELVKNNSPAVVNISTRQTAKHSRKMPFKFQIPEELEGTPWNDLFKHFFDQKPGHDGEAPDQKAQSLGSGFIIDSDGHILTNNHVVEGADEIIVRLNDRRELTAKVIGQDPKSDIALLKVEAENLPVVKLGSSKNIKVGEWVMAIGTPFGFDHSVSAGIVSALGRSLPSENYVPFIQTDVAINPGNSGGPLFNLNGEVIGINSQIYSRTGGFMGLSFAIPVDVAMDVVSQLKERGFVSRGWLGVMIQDVTRELAESFGMKQPKGALVAQVLKDSPADEAGIEVGDIITEYEGHDVYVSSDLPPMVGRTKIGEKAKVKIVRNGKNKTLFIKIGELPSEGDMEVSQSPKQQNKPQTQLGMLIEELQDEQRELFKVDKGGVLVKEVQQNPARAAGIERGDVITRLNNRFVEDVKSFEEIVKDLPEARSVPVLVIRQGSPRFLALKIDD